MTQIRVIRTALVIANRHIGRKNPKIESAVDHALRCSDVDGTTTCSAIFVIRTLLRQVWSPV